MWALLIFTLVCAYIQDTKDAHDVNYDIGDRIWRAIRAAWCNLEITKMTMTTLTEQIALQEASWNHVTPLERLCQKFFAILTRPHLRRHHLHLTTILPLSHPHQNSNYEIIKAILITILPANGRLSLSAKNLLTDHTYSAVSHKQSLFARTASFCVSYICLFIKCVLLSLFMSVSRDILLFLRCQLMPIKKRQFLYLFDFVFV